MTRSGRRLIEDFLLPALNEERYGELLKWIDREKYYFSIRWSHKNAAKWTLEDTAVFQDWDKLKGHYHPELKGYYMQAKQRFRAALYKLNTVRKLPCEDKHVKIYQLVLENDKRRSLDCLGKYKKNSPKKSQKSIPTSVICKNTSYIAKNRSLNSPCLAHAIKQEYKEAMEELFSVDCNGNHLNECCLHANQRELNCISRSHRYILPKTSSHSNEIPEIKVKAEEIVNSLQESLDKKVIVENNTLNQDVVIPHSCHNEVQIEIKSENLSDSNGHSDEKVIPMEVSPEVEVKEEALENNISSLATEIPDVNGDQRTPHVPIQPLPVYTNKSCICIKPLNVNSLPQRFYSSPSLFLVPTYNEISEETDIKQEISDEGFLDDNANSEDDQETIDIALNLSTKSPNSIDISSR